MTEPANTAQGAMQPTHSRPTMAVKIYAPFQIYFEGEAYSVSGINAIGPFDVLPHHRNFLSMLLPCTITVQAPDGVHTVPVRRALMHVKADYVAVFVDV